MDGTKAEKACLAGSHFWPLAGRCILALLASWLIGVLLLWLVFLIPGEAAYQHAVDSVDTLAREGLHENIGNAYGHAKQDTKLDGFTDLLMINFSTNDVQSSVITPLQRAISPAWVVSQSLEDSYTSARFLSYLTNPEPNYNEYYIRRYWAGFIVPVRLLFTFFDYNQIRTLNLVAQIITVLLCFFIVGKKGNWYCAIILLLAYYALQPIAISRSLAYSTCFYIAIIGCCIAAYVSKRHPVHAPPIALFFFLGISVVYFDSLSFPLITLGLPLVVFFSLKGKSLGAEPLPQALLCLLKLCVAWGIGYLGMWGGKWVIAYFAGYVDIFSEALKAAGERVSTTGYSVIQTMLGLEIYCFTRRKIAVLLLPFMVGFVASALSLRKHRQWKEMFTYFSIFFLIAVLPIVWTALMLNHTSLHWFFTHRIMSVFFAALSMAVSYPFVPDGLTSKSGRLLKRSVGCTKQEVT